MVAVFKVAFTCFACQYHFGWFRLLLVQLRATPCGSWRRPPVEQFMFSGFLEAGKDGNRLRNQMLLFP